MFSGKLNGLFIKELSAVFRLCDPEKTGRVQIGYLQELARNCGNVEANSQEIVKILNELDPNGRGTLSFKEFCTGVKAIKRKQRYQHRKWLMSESMMTPTTTNNEQPSTILIRNGSADSTTPPPESKNFQFSPPESPRTSNGGGNGGGGTLIVEQSKSQCSSLSDGENFEWTGEGDTDSGISSDRNLSDGLGTRSPSGINRHTWLRTSLRRSSPNHQDNLPNRRWGSFRLNGKRQLGSNALASQLYRSSSFNSSGRSSTCDTADDMYSDASLEEDVHDLHHKFQVLQQQVGVLQDSAHQNDERYTRAKSDNAALQARVIMLEEQLRDTEIRYDERLQDEQKRYKELLQRLEREKQLQLENADIRLQSSETESSHLKDELNRQRIRLEKLDMERYNLNEQIQDLTNEIITNKEYVNSFKEKERRLKQEHEAQLQLIEELSREIEKLRLESRTPALPTTSPETIRLEELHEEIQILRMKNEQLQETNDELQANLLNAGLEQGRYLTNNLTKNGENSLAAELEAMTHDEPFNPNERNSVVEMQQALKEQQEVNLQLRCYIDGILLNIVENYPQLLEVKRSAS